MKLPLLTFLLAGCAAVPLYSPVRDVVYTAIGSEPFWMVTIGPNRIVLATGREGGRLSSHDYRTVGANLVNGTKRWEAGEGVAVISVEARPRRCEGARGVLFEDEVRVRLSGREMHGCGGRRIERGRR